MDSRQEIQFDSTEIFQFSLRRKWLILVTAFLVVLFITIFNGLSISVFKANTTIVLQELNSFAASTSPFNISLNKNFDIIQIGVTKSQCLTVEVFKALPKNIISTSQIPKPAKQTFNKKVFLAYLLDNRISASSAYESEVINIKIMKKA